MKSMALKGTYITGIIYDQIKISKIEKERIRKNHLP